MKQLFLTILIIITALFTFAQSNYTRFREIDIQHYIFEIQLNDTTNRIEGKATIKAKILQPASKIILDLVGTNDSTNAGMIVLSVTQGAKNLSFMQKEDQLEILFPTIIKKNQTIEFSVTYAGIPGDGLIISQNRFNDRTFFGDNWPNRAHFWLPTIDHPSDKATLEFKVIAPEHYQVVSNGVQVEETNLPNHLKFTHWRENIPISTKIMVIGVARFARLYNTKFNGIPVSSWVFPQNREDGFSDYAIGIRPLAFYTSFIGPFPYEKLANVQSKTRYGGMENASCIFYAEKSVTGKGQAESLMAHEIAHQWFGNSVTERNWFDVWLSEGFATYLTHLYTKQFAGDEMFKLGLLNDRERVIKYARKKWAPVVDTTVTNYNELLNANTYQKASWFLHMLNEKTGDSVFAHILSKYYHDFKDSTALTSDFLHVAENVSGKDLMHFFHEWLYQPGFPQLKVKWSQSKHGKLSLNIQQVQPNNLFSFPLEIEFRLKNGDTTIKKVEVTEWNNKFTLDFAQSVQSIHLDPQVKLLFEEIE